MTLETVYADLQKVTAAKGWYYASSVMKQRERASQPFPYTRQLPYYVTRHIVTSEPIRVTDGGTVLHQDFLMSDHQSDPCVFSAGKSTESMVALLKGELQRRMQDKYYDNSMNLGTDFAELGETVSSLTSALGRFASAYKAMKKGKVRESIHKILGYPSSRPTPTVRSRIPRHLRGVASSEHVKHTQSRLRKGSLTAASAWLEFSYAWAPLIGTIYDYAGVAQNGLGKPHLITMRSSISRSYSGQKTGINRYEKVIRSGGTVSIRVGAVYNIRVVNPKVAALDHLGLLNPLVPAWELVPLSFVADWFLPIGDTIRSLTAFAGCSVDASLSSKVVRDTVCVCYKSTDWYWRLLDTAKRTSHYETFKREVVSPVIGLSFDDLSPRLGTNRLASAASLLTQLLRS